MNDVELSKLVLQREELLTAGLAQCDNCRALFETIKAEFKKRGWNYCAHNLALLGSRRYAQYKNNNTAPIME